MTFQQEARRPSTMWIVVADRARARIFATEWPGLDNFREIKGLAHPEGAAHPRDVESEAPAGSLRLVARDTSGSRRPTSSIGQPPSLPARSSGSCKPARITRLGVASS